MTNEPTSLPDVRILKPDVFPDDRGHFLESYNKEKFAAFGIMDEFVQDSLSVSKKGVLRGMHFQKDPFAQGKLVSVVAGKVFDVAIDLRKNSPTYKKWVGVTLSSDDHTMLYIPKGFAHGFYVLSSEARFFYKISGSLYNKAAVSGIAWNDPEIAIQWPLTDEEPILSSQDRLLPKLSEME